MGLTDILFGRKKLPKAQREALFALSTAQVTLEVELGLRPAGRAAICFKPLSAGEFVRAENELQELLDVVAQSSGSRVRRRSDEYGFQWVVVEDPDFEDLVTTVHLVASQLHERGFGPQLLAAIFGFEGGKSATRPVSPEQQLDDAGTGAAAAADEPTTGRPVYWIYGFKRGAFWPFVPTGQGQERDNAEELELKAKLEGELPIEQDLSRWLALFDAPV